MPVVAGMLAQRGQDEHAIGTQRDRVSVERADAIGQEMQSSTREKLSSCRTQRTDALACRCAVAEAAAA